MERIGYHVFEKMNGLLSDGEHEVNENGKWSRRNPALFRWRACYRESFAGNWSERGKSREPKGTQRNLKEPRFPIFNVLR